MEDDRKEWEIEEELKKKKSLSNVRIDEDELFDIAANLNRS